MAFPNVPIAPGVPPLPRAPGADPFTLILLTADTIIGLAGLFSQTWGIYQDGLPVVTPDTMVSMSYSQDWKIPNYALEQGSFASYNKVSNPYETRVRMATGGSVLDRQAFLQQVEDIAGTTDLYDVVTPEETYLSANITKYEYHRAATEGLGILVIDISLTEIRLSVQASFSNTQQPSGASPVSGGQVTPTTPTATQQNSAAFVQ